MANQLTLATLNVNCAKNRRSPFKLLEELKLFLIENNCDILSLTETDFENTQSAEDFNIPGYKTFLQKTEKKVRTVILTKSELEVIDVSKDLAIPTVSVELRRTAQKNLVISSIYRQWSTETPKEDLCSLEDILSSASSGKTHVMMGDFNIDANRLVDPSYQHYNIGKTFQDFCNKCGFHIKTGGPTYHYSSGASALDFFLINEDVKGNVKCVSFPSSDHEATIMHISNSKIPRKSKIHEITVRGRIRNEAKFKNDIQRAMLDCIATFEGENANEQAMMITKSFRNILDLHAPMRTKTIRGYGPKHTLSESTLTLMKLRNKARNIWITASPNEKKIKQEIFKRLRNKVNSAIKKDRVQKAEYHLQIGQNAFKVADELLGKKKEKQKPFLIEHGKEVTDEKEVADIFNSFFVEKIRKLKENIDPKLRTDPLIKVIDKSSRFSFNLVSPTQVEKIIAKMKNSPSAGVDGISARMLKMVKKEMAPVISMLINTSLESGVFPECFKLAKITPIFKNKGCATDKCNYRPVSGLSAVGKVLEVAANIQITRYSERVGILGSHQHGFRSGRSTTTALISSLTKWQTAKEHKKYTGCLLYDLSAAYDTISPEILVDKAMRYGFDKTSCDWLRSFTTERYQAVSIGQSTSDMMKLECGVPQGSPISCTLFLIYIQDITQWVKKGELQGYADDTLHFVSSMNPQEVINGLEEQARELFTFFASNELVANPGKTAFLMFKPTRSTADSFVVNIDGVKIKESECERILGVHVQQNLQWDTHVDKIIGKVNYGLSKLKQLQGIMRQKSLKMLANGLVFAHVRYAIAVFMSGMIRVAPNDPKNTHLNTLQVKQNDCMRIILNKKRSDKVPNEMLLNKTSMKSINHMAAEAMLLELWKAKHFKIDNVWESYSKDKCTRRESQYRSSKDKTSFISKSICLWNQMSSEFHSGLTTMRSAKTDIGRFIKQVLPCL